MSRTDARVFPTSGTVTIRWFSLPPLVASRTPIARERTTQPGNVGADTSEIASSGSPSPPRVPAMKPKSNGKTAPEKRTRLSRKMPSFSSYLYLFCEP